MSTLSQDALDLLGQSPQGQDVGAEGTTGAPEAPRASEEAIEFARHQTDGSLLTAAEAEAMLTQGPLPAGAVTDGKGQKLVPLAALLGEQEVTRKAREEAARYQAALREANLLDEEGNVRVPSAQVPPLPPDYGPAYPTQPTPSMPAPNFQGQQVAQFISSVADDLGIAPEKVATLGAVFVQMARQEMMRDYAPLVESVGEVSIKGYEAYLDKTDSDFPTYRHAFRACMSQFAPGDRGNPMALNLAREIAIGKTYSQLRTRHGGGGGEPKTVGRFTEGAASTVAERKPESPGFSDATLDWAKRSGYTREELDRAEERHEVRGGKNRGRGNSGY